MQRTQGKDAEYGARYRSKNVMRERERARVKRQKFAATARAYLALKRAKQKMATPKWANKRLIALVYRRAVKLDKTAGSKWHVDHIIPLNSPLVCGLHVDANLQVIPEIENLRKNNRHWPDMP